MTIKITTPNGGSDSLDFGCAQTAIVATVTGTEVSSGEGKLELKTTTGGTSAAKMTIAANGTVTLASPSLSNLAVNLQTAVATTSGTSIDFTGIPAGVKRITVIYNGLSTNGTSVFLAQLGDSGGFETSGYTGRAVRNGPTNNIYSSAFGAGFLLSDSIAAANVYIGSIKLEHIGSEEWIASGSQNTLTAINEASQFNGAKTLSGVITQFRLTTVNGSDAFDAGKVNISWEF